MGLDRRVIVVVVVTMSYLLPAATCLGLALPSFASRLDLAVALLAGAAWLALLLLVNWWEFAGLWLRPVWGVTFAVIACSRVLTLPALPAFAPPGAGILACAALAGLALALLAGALAARGHAGEALALALPFDSGRFLLTDGGDGGRSFLVNYHYGFGRHRASGAARSMRYATDIVELVPGGRSARGFLPRRNEAYAIWSRPLLAPCEGSIVHVENAVADNPAFGTHRPYGVGNHVVIRAGDAHIVVLGHLRQGSVTVRVGDPVRTGDPVGAVGNSGWTERPHLHLQAMRSPGDDWWHGEPVPVRFAGRFPVRNDVLRAARSR